MMGVTSIFLARLGGRLPWRRGLCGSRRPRAAEEPRPRPDSTQGTECGQRARERGQGPFPRRAARRGPSPVAEPVSSSGQRARPGHARFLTCGNGG